MPPATMSPKPLPFFCAAACVAICAISLLGWIAGIDWMTSLAPGLPRLVPMTATLLLLASFALGSQAGSRPRCSGAGVAAATLVSPPPSCCSHAIH